MKLNLGFEEFFMWTCLPSCHLQGIASSLKITLELEVYYFYEGYNRRAKAPSYGSARGIGRLTLKLLSGATVMILPNLPCHV